MPSFAQDKVTERDRYDRRAGALLASTHFPFGHAGAATVPLVIRRPYLVYESFIRRSVRQGASALDVCCGTGLFSLIAAKAGADVTASDIAENNLTLARMRSERAGISLKTAIGDAEHLPFPDCSFDLITCAGSLSYLDLGSFLAEVQRVLRPSGWFVCVDSLNHNPTYRFNRELQFLRGLRTRATLVRMPTLATIARLEATFADCEKSFHGIGSFLAPVLRPLLGEVRTAAWLDDFDLRHHKLHKWAFKFVLRGRKKSS